MTTATAVIDVAEPVAEPLRRAVRLLPGGGRQDRREPPEPVPAPAADHARTRPAHCRFAMHYED
ncbi:hypothetical protein [Kitasatospora sp. NPDC005856]|uniref:hypothetical protein n=1 Tax=Kitasatospora sp. NPDC005856 TaxID=3154566 RepID=UPI003400B256